MIKIVQVSQYWYSTSVTCRPSINRVTLIPHIKGQPPIVDRHMTYGYRSIHISKYGHVGCSMFVWGPKKGSGGLNQQKKDPCSEGTKAMS